MGILTLPSLSKLDPKPEPSRARGKHTPEDGSRDLSPPTKAALLYLCASLGVLVLVGVLAVMWRRFWQGSADFLQLYTGAFLVGTNGLYSPVVNREVQLLFAGFTMDAVRYVRLPFYAAALHPLALLPYRAAYWVFQALSLAAAGYFAGQFRRPWQLAAAVLLFFPLLVSFVVGQDVTLVLAIWTVAILLYRSGRRAAAGFVFSLCIIKFHLFLLVPLVLIRHRMWRLIGGAAGGVAVWLAASTLVAGPAWPRQYLAVLRNPAISPGLQNMPSIWGILSGSPLAGLAAVALFGLVLYAIVRLRDFEAGLAIALAGGVLLNTHSYVQDCAFLLPALVSAIRHGRPAARGMAVFMMTPIPYCVLLLGHGGVLLLCVAALVLLRSAGAEHPSGGLCSVA